MRRGPDRNRPTGDYLLGFSLGGDVWGNVSRRLSFPLTTLTAEIAPYKCLYNDNDDDDDDDNNNRCLNIRSLNNKLDDVLEVRLDQCIDVLFLVETWVA